MDIISVGSDGNIRHIRRPNRGAPVTAVLTLPPNSTFRSQPTVVGYGSGYLEVVTASQSGSLYHWRFQNGVWTKPVQVSGYVISQPILANLGDGKLVLLALGSDRRVYYWGFTNGAWSAFRRFSDTVVVNENFFSELAASSWGDGSLDLAMVENGTGALYHGRISAGYLHPNVIIREPFARVGGVLTDTPILTAFSSTRLNVLAVGTDHSVYSAWTSSVVVNRLNTMGIAWSGYHGIGGTNLKMGGVAKLGANELIAAGTDANGKVMLSHFTRGGWMQFQPVIGQSGNSLKRPTINNFGD